MDSDDSQPYLELATLPLPVMTISQEAYFDDRTS